MAERRKRSHRKPSDGLDGDFGPGFDAAASTPPGEAGAKREESGTGRRDAGFSGLGGGIPCGGDGCFLKPVGDLVGRFALELARRGHSDSAARAATSGLGFLRALRDFLDEEIAFAERAAEARRSSEGYTKIPVE